jgi:hypothetical protein
VEQENGALVSLVSRARKDLIEPRGSTVAWAAYTAGRLRLRDLEVDLREALRVWGSSNEGQLLESRHVQNAILGALVEIGARVPASEVWSYLPDSSAFLLVAGRVVEEPGPLLVAFLRGGLSSAEWTAAGNLLLAAKAPGFPRALLEAASYELHIVVSDGELSTDAIASPMGDLQLPTDMDGGTVCEAPSGISGFPPFVRYELLRGGQPGMVLVAGGAQPVYARRIEGFMWNSVTYLRKVERQRLIWDWLGDIARMPPIVGERVVEVRFSTIAEYRERVRKIQFDCREECRRLVEALVAGGVIDAEGWIGTMPSIRTIVSDVRESRREELPDIPNREVR